MGVVAHRRRYANLRRIERLDPETDYDEIASITSRYEFPWDYVQGTGIAFLRDYGVPSIARLLDATHEFEDHGVKRYDDTLLFGEEATVEGIDSPRSHEALRRLNRIHGHYDIPNDEFQYVLATTIVGPVRWIGEFGWRDLHAHELAALARVTTRFGELMGIRGLPTTYDGYARLLDDYEAEHFAFTPANRRVTEATLRIARDVAPLPLRPFVRRVTIALMDEPLRVALGMPRQPAWFVRAVRLGLRARGRLLRLAPPRRTAYHHRPSTYPMGYGLGDLGPASMLDDLNREGTHRMTRREIFDDEHEAFRDAVGAFLDKEVVPHHDQWEKDGIVDREVWAKAGTQGLLGLQLDEEYGGGGTPDFRYNVVIGEEMTRRGVYGAAFPLFNDMIVPYLVASANEEQKRRWFPALASGEKIAAIAMSEPGAGSDLQGIRTTAVDHGDHYVLNGQKTFISNGILADLVIVVARTDPDAGHQGISLLVVERGMEGFERGRNLDKIGQHAQDTAELFFEDVHVPKENLLGDEGAGFLYLMTNLSQERLSIAVSAASACELVLDETLRYAKERTAFGKPIGKFQHNRFVIAEMATEAHIARVFIDDCITRHVAGELDAATASMAKWWTTELQKKLVDQGVQMHGGYGYMMEYPIARAFVNSRVQTIYGGTTEIQKEIIGRSLGL